MDILFDFPLPSKMLFHMSSIACRNCPLVAYDIITAVYVRSSTLLVEHCKVPNFCFTLFCGICGEYTIQHSRKANNTFVQRAYLAYYKVMMGCG